MDKITTEVCKEYLINHFQMNGVITNEKDWKRTRKYKNEEGNWVRVFAHPTVGSVNLLEGENGTLAVLTEDLSLSNQVKPSANSQNKKSFDLRVFTKEQLKKAWKAYKKYYDPNDDPDDDFLRQYRTEIRYIPGILNWYVPLDAYENELLKPSKIDWSFNMKGYNIFMFDLENFHEYGGESYMLGSNLPNYLNKVDEYHYEIEKDITVEELVRDLSFHGYKHVNKYSGESSAIKKLMSSVTYREIPLVEVESALEKDVLNDDITKYTVEELKGATINQQGLYSFSFFHEKIKVIDFLIDNQIEISLEDLDIITKNLYVKDNSNEKLEKLFDILLKLENITLNKHALIKVVNLLELQNREDLMIPLFNKFGTEENVLLFAQTKTIINNPLNHDLFVKRFSKHDDELEDWIDAELAYPQSDLTILGHKNMRQAITKEFILGILDTELKRHIENATYETNRSAGGFTIVEQYSDGRQLSLADKANLSLAQFVVIKNKILSYFSDNDDDNTPKKVYKTKF